MQRRKIDLRVDRGGLRAAVPQDLSDLVERGAAAQHLCGQRVAQQVRSLEGRFDASPSQGTAHQAADRAGAAQSASRRTAAEEQVADGALGTRLAQVVCDGRAHISRQRQAVTALGWAANTDEPIVPVDARQLKVDHFAGTQAKARQQQQDRKVTATRGASSVASLKQTLYLRCRYRLGQTCHRPVRHGRHAAMQVDRDVAAVAAILQERAQRRDHDLGALRMSKAGCFGLHEANDVSSSEPMKLDLVFAEDLPQESSNRIAIQTNRGSGEPALAQQILLECLPNLMIGRDCGGRRRYRGSSSIGTKPNESMERVGVAAAAPSLQPSIVKVLGSIARLHAAGLDLALIEPSHEVGNQPHRRPDGRRSVSLSRQLFGE